MNKVILSGYLIRDPEVRTTSSDKSVATFGISVRRGWKKAEDGQYPPSDIFNVIAWDRLAEFCRNYLTKGSKIFVEGRLQVRDYEKDGIKRYVTEVIANEIEFAGSKGERSREGGFDERPSDRRSSAPGNELEHVDDVDIPF